MLIFASPPMISDEKMVVLVPNRGSVSFCNLMMHYVNVEKIGTGQQWSVLLDGQLSEAV